MNERTVRRAREVRRRARQYRRRREGRLNGALSVCSLLLLTGIGTLCRDAQTPGLALAAQDGTPSSASPPSRRARR